MLPNIPTTYFIRLRGKLYTSKSASGPCCIVGELPDGSAFFWGPNAQQAAGAFAFVKARCEIPSVNADNEILMFDKVLKEVDNVGS